MKRVQVGYLEDVKTRDYIENNIPSQKKSEFIRKATAKAVAEHKEQKKK